MTEIVQYGLIGKEDLRLGNGTFRSQLADGRIVTLSEIFLPEYATDSGTTDAYAIDIDLKSDPYITGNVYYFKANTSNTGAATLDINSNGAKSIVKSFDVALRNDDTKAGQVVAVIYDGTNFQLLSPIGTSLDQSGGQIYAADGGSNDTYAITLNPVPSAYTTGMVINFLANTKNTGACTLNVNGLGAKNIRKYKDVVLVNDDIKASQIVSVVYDGTNFQLLSQVGATIDQTGRQIYAADEGSTDTYVVTLTPTPPAYVTGMVVNFKANTINTGACTLNVNGLGAKTIKKSYNIDLEDGEIKANQLISVIYDGTNFQLISVVGSQDYVSQDGSQIYAEDSGSTDTYVITLSPVPTAYVTGMVVNFKANTKNTGACSLNVNSLGAIALKTNGDEALNNDDIQANQLVSVIYDGTNFQIIGTTGQLFPSGSSGQYFKPNLTKISSGSEVGTGANTDETTIVNDTLLANSLDVSGMGIEVVCAGTTGANGDTKRIKAKFGTTIIIDSGVLVLNDKDWRISYELVRKVAGTQKAIGRFEYDGASPIVTYTTVSEDETTNLAIQITGQNGAATANDIVQEMYFVKIINDQ